MKKLIFLITILLSFQSTALALDSWEEDLDGDGRQETRFYDDDGDGNPDNASVDRDGDGNYEEYWVDEDDDGDWDRKWWDSDGDETWDRGRFDHDDDGNWDEEWTDRNGNGEVDGNGGERDDIDVPINGPRPALAVAERVECNCAGPREEPDIAAISTSPSANLIVWTVGGLLVLGLIFVLWKRKNPSETTQEPV